MAVSPINVATQGLLNSPLAVAAIRGRLIIETDTPVTPIPGGPFNALLGPRWKHPQQVKDQLRAQIEREDEEILAIISAFIRTIN